MTIANMTTEWGALAGVFPFDEVTVKYLRSRVAEFSNPNRPGKRGPEESLRLHQRRYRCVVENRSEVERGCDAEYAIELELDLATVVPHVSGPNEVKTMVSLAGNGAKARADSEGVFVVVRERALRRFA